LSSRQITHFELLYVLGNSAGLFVSGTLTLSAQNEQQWTYTSQRKYKWETDKVERVSVKLAMFENMNPGFFII
jgi:hypothetical protein